MSNRESKRKRVIDTSILIFPNLFTTGNLFCGFYSIVCSLKGNFMAAAYLILAAAVFDMVDGRVARLVKSVSEFGKEYDSLADIVSFGVAPAIMAYLCNLVFLPKVGWLAAFLFVACGALRLARFNVIYSNRDPRYFVGLPIPVAASMVATCYLFLNDIRVDVKSTYILVVTALSVSFLMVSSVNYKSYKKAQDAVRKNFFANMVMFLLLLVVVAVQPEITLFIIGAIYIVHGLILEMYNRASAFVLSKRARLSMKKENMGL